MEGEREGNRLAEMERIKDYGISKGEMSVDGGRVEVVVENG